MQDPACTEVRTRDFREVTVQEAGSVASGISAYKTAVRSGSGTLGTSSSQLEGTDLEPGVIVIQATDGVVGQG